MKRSLLIVLGVASVAPFSQCVAEVSPAYLYSPTWSPDATRIAYLRSYVYAAFFWPMCHEEIRVRQSDGSRSSILAESYESCNILTSLDWSPDGSQIAFEAGPYGGGYIYVMNDDGTLPTNATRYLAVGYGPSWSPSGSEIAFGKKQSGDGNSEIYAIDLSSREIISLTSDGAENEWPSWSPDGTHIAYISNDRLSLLDTVTGSTNIVVDVPARGESPAWSPDGTMIAFADDTGQIHVVDRQGNAVMTLGPKDY